MTPDLPKLTVDIAPTPDLRTTPVRPGDLQLALDNARAGDALILEGAANYGAVTLPAKDATGYIRIATPPGQTPANILGGEGSIPAIATAPGAHHYRFERVVMKPEAGKFNTGLVRIGSGDERVLADIPHHFIFDTCQILGEPTLGGKRGLAANGAYIAVVDSMLLDWHTGGYDTQALACWNGPGPFLLLRSTFEASGENVMFGGADAAMVDLVPSDITIQACDFPKRLSWRGNPNATVKNLFELKNARRVLVEDCTFTNCWKDGQTGTALNIKSSNQDGTAPWSVTEHVTFRRNRVSHAAGALVLSTQLDTPAVALNHILIYNNNFSDISAALYGEVGQFLKMLGPMHDVTIDGNWCENDGSFAVMAGEPMPGIVIVNNTANHGPYGVKGDGTASGRATLDMYCPQAIFTGNALAGGAANALQYPSGNTFPAVLPPQPVPAPVPPDPTPEPVPPVPTTPTISVTIPAGRTVAVTRRRKDSSAVALTVNKGDTVLVNGVTQP